MHFSVLLLLSLAIHLQKHVLLAPRVDSSVLQMFALGDVAMTASWGMQMKSHFEHLIS